MRFQVHMITGTRSRPTIVPYRLNTIAAASRRRRVIVERGSKSPRAIRQEAVGAGEVSGVDRTIVDSAGAAGPRGAFGPPVELLASAHEHVRDLFLGDGPLERRLARVGEWVDAMLEAWAEEGVCQDGRLPP